MYYFQMEHYNEKKYDYLISTASWIIPEILWILIISVAKEKYQIPDFK